MMRPLPIPLARGRFTLDHSYTGKACAGRPVYTRNNFLLRFTVPLRCALAPLLSQ